MSADRNVEGARALLATLGAEPPKRPRAFTMPGQRPEPAKVEQAQGRPVERLGVLRVLVIEFGGTAGERQAQDHALEIGPDAELPPWFVPVNLCPHGLKINCGAGCTVSNTGRSDGQ